MKLPFVSVLRPTSARPFRPSSTIRKAAEPNPHLTPDRFHETVFDTPQAYAVEMPEAFWR